ncbi:spindle assembly abnormal 6 isoform X2 [Haematobia irritans]|uniref:spindle assembly abnormal 6 isoform X2 n=1 Tax=Haematobia irritans TaxID=7368 RepID=UPI003F4FFEFD
MSGDEYDLNNGTSIYSGEILVNFRFLNSLSTQKCCVVHGQKIEFQDIIQLRLTEKCDQRKMYITTVDSSSFQQLKQDQSLHVSFSGFVHNLMHLLNECHAGKLNICLVELHISGSLECSEKESFQLQFVETRSFKNLVHLSLPCRIAPLNVVLFYLNNITDRLQTLLLAEENNRQLQKEVHIRNERIDNLETEANKLRKTFSENIKNIEQKHSEEILKLKETLRSARELRQQDNERSRLCAKNLQIQIDTLKAEKNVIQIEKSHEQKRNEKLNEEVNSLKVKLSNIKESNDKLCNELSTLKNIERKHDMHLQDLRKEISELKEQLNKCEKGKAELIAELEAEKKISHGKRQALEIATDEISKANKIILKHSQDLCKMKNILSWRTEVALQQEKAIRDKETLIQQRDEQIAFLKQTVNDLRNVIPKELDSIRKCAALLETKYSDQIKSLMLKLIPPGQKQ